MSERILLQQREGYLLAKFNRPEARNAMDAPFVKELHALCDQLEAEPQVLVLTGSEGFFAAGADIRQLRDRTKEEALMGINGRAFDRVARLPMPTIAAVNGPAIGGGAEIAYACDLRIATPKAKFGNPEPNLGILAGAGATWRLRDLVGLSIASEVLLFGKTLTAEESLSCGLVSAVVEESELDSALNDLVAKVNALSPFAVRITKLALNAAAGAHPTIDDVAQAALFQTEERYARMEAFLNKSKKS